MQDFKAQTNQFSADLVFLWALTWQDIFSAAAGHSSAIFSLTYEIFDVIRLIVLKIEKINKLPYRRMYP